MHRAKASCFATILVAASFTAAADSASISASMPDLNPAMKSDILARSAGNDRVAARDISREVFSRIQPAQILKVTVNRAGDHRVAGLLLSGVKFHTPLNRREFTDEIVSLIAETFNASTVEEVDVRAVVPLAVGRGATVSGDNAVPIFREVFTVTALRSESQTALRSRIDSGTGVFWEPWFVREQLGRNEANSR